MTLEELEPGDEAESEARDPAFDALMREVAEAPRVAPELVSGLNFERGQAIGSPTRRLPNPGEVIDGRYLIESELGRGGMGMVFAARNLRTQRDVALKWMLPRVLYRSSAEREESISRFVREARAVSRVDHPNVVRVLDVGGDPEMPYLVMERLQGETLRTRLARSPLAWDEALLLLEPVLDGVAAAHRAGVIHRDLKPDNIFLSLSGIKVLDFGVSRIGGDEAHASLTRTGTMLGTPAYMPLEQLRGHREVDERTDVYALGVILYEALSGRLPFEAQSAADQAVLLATRSPVSLSELRPELRGARSDAVMKALAREASDRHPSVEAMRVALQVSAVHAGPRKNAIALVIALVASLVVLASWRHSVATDTARRPTPSRAQRTSQAKPPSAPTPRAIAKERTPTSPVEPAAAMVTDRAEATDPPAESGRKQTPRSDAPRAPTMRVKAAPVATPQSAVVQAQPGLPTSLSVEDFRTTNAKTPQDAGESRPSSVASDRQTPPLDRSEF